MDGADEEAALFDALCALDAPARQRRLSALPPALAARLRRLLDIDRDYGAHTARSVVPADMPDPLGDVSDVGAFRLVRRIGRGGMGVVYLAERRDDFRQQVAIKLMPRFADDGPGRARFARERRILAQLRHPNICSIVDGGELGDGTPWLAMEFVSGQALCDWCARTGADAQARVGLFLQLCDAVQYAHRNLVIHRDLKDGNVLVDEHGTVKLLDFGIAKSLQERAGGDADGDADGEGRAGDGEAVHTVAQDRFFSPMTAAPEQVRGERATVAVDVYALGALLHQLLCGELPFARPRRDPVALQRAIMETVPPRMSEIRQRAAGDAAGAGDTGAAHWPIPAHALRGELDAIVAHCLRKDPGERYAEVGDLARDLRAWRSGHPLAIAADDRLYRARKFLRRNRVAVALGTLAIAGVLGALALTLWQAGQLRTERDAAQAARQRSESDRDRARAVAAFMRDTFEQADPGKASESGLLARDLLERGKHRLDRLDGQRDLQAEVALLLAESDAAMGLVRESQAGLRAHAPAIEALAAVDPGMRWRARLLAFSNALELAPDGPALDTALAELRALAATPEARVQVARQQERLYARRSEFGLAADTLQAAWRAHAGALDPDARLRLQVDLGTALLNSGRDGQAQRLCAAIDRTGLRQRDPALQIRALRLIARELKRRGDAPAALAAIIGDWQRTAERLYGDTSIEAANAYFWAVGVTADPDAQEALIRRAYAIHLAKQPPTSMALARAEYNVAIYWLQLRQRPAQAEPHLARAAAIGRAAASRAHADVRKFELSWALALNALGRPRTTLAQLAAPPGIPEDHSDAETLGALQLALADAALATRQPEQARARIAEVDALWRRMRAPVPAPLADHIRRIRRTLPAPSGG